MNLRKKIIYIFIIIIAAVEPNILSAQGKNFIRGLQGKDSLAMGKVLLGTMIVPGYGQAYNRDYWKIPVIYAGIGGGIASGLYFNSKLKDAQRARNMLNEIHTPGFPPARMNEYINKYQNTANKYNDYKRNRDLSYLGAGMFYLAGALDAVASYKTDKTRNPVSPQRATLYSALLPGLGQAYNGEYWKIPIIYGGLGFCAYWINQCDSEYSRYRTAYNKKYAVENGTSTDLDEFGGRYSLTTLKNARETARRNRDLTILVTGLVYILNIVDANVFAHLSYFDINDDLSLQCEPVLFNETSFASGNITPSVGLKLKLKF
ncbi:MAG: DUF5683 domain-containing protein [Prevotellaceae bacterium]|jgi:hypothetical protein|nr:DUF5683 domain-containing protein [Prevotellaceae bacterium]